MHCTAILPSFFTLLTSRLLIYLFTLTLYSYYCFLSATMMKGKFSVKSSKVVKSSVTKPQGWLGCFLPNHSSFSDDFFPFLSFSFLSFFLSFVAGSFPSLSICIDRKSCRHEECWYCEDRLLVLGFHDCGKSHGTCCHG